MPRVDIGNEDTRTGEGKKGEFQIKFKEIAEKIMRAKSADSNFPDSLRVTYQIVGTEDTVSLSVPISDPAESLFGFCEDRGQAPTTEGDLREFIKGHAIKDPVYVYVRDSFVRNRLAPEGEHIFTHIIGVWTYDNAEGSPKIGFTAADDDGLTTTWNCKNPQLRYEVGDTPDQDYIGGEAELNPNQWAFQYLQAFGLKWDRLKNDIVNAPALWPGHYGGDDRPIEPLFPKTSNPWPGFLNLIERHGGNAVRMEIVRHPQYGLGPKRTGQFPIVKMMPIEVVGGPGPGQAEFNAEAARFMADWDTLTQVLYARQDVRFMIGGKFTAEGHDVALTVLKPIVHAHPAAVTKFKDDGTPIIRIPPDGDAWRLNGVVCMNFLAERLVAAEGKEPGALFNLVNLSDPEPEKLLAWAAQNVPELSGAMEESDGEEL